MEKIKRLFFVNWLKIFIIIILIATSLFVYSTTNSIFDFYKLNTNVDGIISTNSLHCKIEGKSTVDITTLVESKEYNQINIFKETNTNALKAYEVFLLNSHFFDTYNGDIFSSDDYFSNQKKAIVGSEVHKITDINRLNINDHNYDVIGEFTNSTIASQNYIVIYCNGNDKYISTDGVFILDGNKKDVNKAYNFLANTLHSQGLKIQKIDVEKVSLTKLIAQSNSIFSLVVFVCVLLLLIYILLVVFWLNSQEQYIGVCNILGIPHIKIKLFFDFLKKYFVAYIIGTLISFVIYNSITHIFYVFFIIFLICTFIVCISLFIGLKCIDFKELKSVLESDYE